MIISKCFYRVIVTVHAVCTVFIFSCWGAKKPEPTPLKTMTEVLAALDARRVKTIKGNPNFKVADFANIVTTIQQALDNKVITEKTVNQQDEHGNSVLHLIFGVNYDVPYVKLPGRNPHLPSVVFQSNNSEVRVNWEPVMNGTNDGVKTLKPLLEQLLTLQANVVMRNDYPIKDQLNHTPIKTPIKGRGYSPYLILREIYSATDGIGTPDDAGAKFAKKTSLESIEQLLNILKDRLLVQAQAGDHDAIEQWLIDFQKSDYLWSGGPIADLFLNPYKVDQNEFIILFKSRLSILGRVLGLGEPPALVVPAALPGLAQQCAAERADLERLKVSFDKLNDYGVVALHAVLQQYVTKNVYWLAYPGQEAWKTYFDTIKKKLDDAFPAAQQRLLTIKKLEAAITKRDFTEFQEIFTKLSELCGSDAKASNFLDATKKPFLYTAVSCGFVQAVTFLLDKGADPTMTFNGIAPLRFAKYLHSNVGNKYNAQQLQEFDAIITALNKAMDAKKVPEEGAAVTLAKALKILQEKLSSLASVLAPKK